MRKVAEKLGNAGLAALLAAVAGGCPMQPGDEETGEILAGEWRDRQGTIYGFDERGNFDYIQLNDGRKIFDSGEKTIYEQNLHGIWGFEDLAETSLNGRDFDAVLNRTHYQFDIIEFVEEASISGHLLTDNAMYIKIDHGETCFLRGEIPYAGAVVYKEED